MDGACLRSETGKCDRGGGRGEVDHGLRLGKSLYRVIRHGHANRLAASDHTDILADPVVAFPFQEPHKAAFVRGQHRFGQHLAHLARCAGDHDAWKLCHATFLCWFRLS